MKPKIRFNGFEEEWETPFLYQYLEISEEINTPTQFGKDDVLSVSDEFGVVNQIEHLGRSYAGKSISKYKILRSGQIVYTKSPLRDKPFGIIKENCNQAGIVSVLYAVYNVNEGISPNYIQRYFEPKARINKYLLPLVNKGAKNTMNISDEAALSGKITIPTSLTEQRMIASWFSNLDALIRSSETRLSALRQVKAASLQAMFPQEGETTPQLRFKGFEGEWKKLPLCAFAHKKVSKNIGIKYNITLTNSAEYGVINQLNFFDHDITNKENIGGYNIIDNDDFVYNPRISATAPVGPINRNLLGYSGIMSPLYLIFSVKGINKDFLSYFFKTKLWHRHMKLYGNSGARFDRLSISDADFFNIPISLPQNETEQQRIASYFTALDHRIALETERVEKLRQVKAACLSGMFA